MGTHNRKTSPLTITLPHDKVKLVKSLVASGQYATDSEVIRDGLRMLNAREIAMSRWLREEVIPAYQQLKVGPQSGMTVGDVRKSLVRRRKKST